MPHQKKIQVSKTRETEQLTQTTMPALGRQFLEPPRHPNHEPQPTPTTNPLSLPLCWLLCGKLFSTRNSEAGLHNNTCAPAQHKNVCGLKPELFSQQVAASSRSLDENLRLFSPGETRDTRYTLTFCSPLTLIAAAKNAKGYRRVAATYITMELCKGRLDLLQILPSFVPLFCLFFFARRKEPENKVTVARTSQSHQPVCIERNLPPVASSSRQS